MIKTIMEQSQKIDDITGARYCYDHFVESNDSLSYLWFTCICYFGQFWSSKKIFFNDSIKYSDNQSNITWLFSPGGVRIGILGLRTVFRMLWVLRCDSWWPLSSSYSCVFLVFPAFRLLAFIGESHQCGSTEPFPLSISPLRERPCSLDEPSLPPELPSYSSALSWRRQSRLFFLTSFLWQVIAAGDSCILPPPPHTAPQLTCPVLCHRLTPTSCSYRGCPPGSSPGRAWRRGPSSSPACLLVPPNLTSTLVNLRCCFVPTGRDQHVLVKRLFSRIQCSSVFLLVYMFVH